MTRKKRLIEQLQEKRQKQPPARKGVVAILSNKEEIAEALDHGFTMKEIHSLMVKNGEMPIGYSVFTRLVNKYIKGKVKGKEQPETKTVQEVERLPRGAKEAFKKDKKGSVCYNPDNHDPDKLIG